MSTNPETFFTVHQISAALAVSARSVRRWIQSKELAAHRLGRSVRIAESDFEAFRKRRRE